MSRSRSSLCLTLAVWLLVGCGDRGQPLAAGDDAGGLRASEGLVRMTFPGDFPGIPAYARIEPVPPHVHIVDGWAVIAFYREPGCVRPDFDLLELFDPPAAFGCPLTVAGFALFETGVFPGAPKVAHAKGNGAVPFWFVPEPVLLAAIQDGELTIGELAALEGLLVGSASRFTEMLQPFPDPVLGGGHPNPKLIQTAHGTLSDGRSFHYHVTVVEGEVESIGLSFH